MVNLPNIVVHIVPSGVPVKISLIAVVAIFGSAQIQSTGYGASSQKPVAQGGQVPVTILVLDVRPIGLPDAIAAPLTAQIAEKLSAWPKYKVTTLADVKDTLTLETTKRLLGCKEDLACVAEASRNMDSDLILSSSVGRIGNQVVVSLTLIDARKNSPIGRASDTAGSLERLPSILPGLLASLLGLEGAQTTPRFKLAKGQKLSFAIFDLTPTGVSKEITDNLTQVLSVEIKRIEGSTVVSQTDLVAMLQLEEKKTLMGCAGDTSCLAEIGGALGVDKLIVGNVGKLAESYMISLRMINPRETMVDSRVTESFRGTQDQLIRAVRFAGRRLLGISSEENGQLALSASEEEATVYVDNRKRGEIPMPPLGNLQSGRHIVRLTKSGFFNWQSEVYVDPGETTAVWAKLTEKPEKWYQKWWVWTLVGVAVAGGVTAAVLLGAGKEAPPPYGDVSPGDLNVNINRGMVSW